MPDKNFADAFNGLYQGKKYSRMAWTATKPNPDGGEPITYHTHWLQKETAGEQDIFVQVSNGNKNTYGVNNVDLHANDWVELP